MTPLSGGEGHALPPAPGPEEAVSRESPPPPREAGQAGRTGPAVPEGPPRRAPPRPPTATNRPTQALARASGEQKPAQTSLASPGQSEPAPAGGRGRTPPFPTLGGRPGASCACAARREGGPFPTAFPEMQPGPLPALPSGASCAGAVGCPALAAAASCDDDALGQGGGDRAGEVAAAAAAAVAAGGGRRGAGRRAAPRGRRPLPGECPGGPRVPLLAGGAAGPGRRPRGRASARSAGRPRGSPRGRGAAACPPAAASWGRRRGGGRGRGCTPPPPPPPPLPPPARVGGRGVGGRPAVSAALGRGRVLSARRGAGPAGGWPGAEASGVCGQGVCSGARGRAWRCSAGGGFRPAKHS